MASLMMQPAVLTTVRVKTKCHACSVNVSNRSGCLFPLLLSFYCNFPGETLIMSLTFHSRVILKRLLSLKHVWFCCVNAMLAMSSSL